MTNKRLKRCLPNLLDLLTDWVGEDFFNMPVGVVGESNAPIVSENSG